MYQTVLVPVDGSELSEKVLPHVREMAKRFDAEIVLLQAITPLTQILVQTAAPGTVQAAGAAPDLTIGLAEQQYGA